MSKRKKTSTAPAAAQQEEGEVTTRAAVPPEVVQNALTEEGSPLGDSAPAPAPIPAQDDDYGSLDAEATVNLSGDLLLLVRDDLDAPTVAASGDDLAALDGVVQRKHLRGLLEALVFASDTPIKANELAKLASAPLKQVKELLAKLKDDYAERGLHLEEVAGGWVFRTRAQYAPFIRDLTKQKPVRLTRAQVETLAIIAYRQPITRPEIDDVRGVDTGPVLKLLLERDLVRILGKRDEPGRPLIYGTTPNFLEFFGLKSLKDLPTLREFTELTEESRQTYEEELGEESQEISIEEAPAASAEEGERAVSESMRIPIEGGAELEGEERTMKPVTSAVPASDEQPSD